MAEGGSTPMSSVPLFFIWRMLPLSKAQRGQDSREIPILSSRLCRDLTMRPGCASLMPSSMSWDIQADTLLTFLALSCQSKPKLEEKRSSNRSVKSSWRDFSLMALTHGVSWSVLESWFKIQSSSLWRSNILKSTHSPWQIYSKVDLRTLLILSLNSIERNFLQVVKPSSLHLAQDRLPDEKVRW